MMLASGKEIAEREREIMINTNIHCNLILGSVWSLV